MTFNKSILLFAAACCLYFGINSLAGDLSNHLTYIDVNAGVSGNLDINQNKNGTYSVIANLQGTGSNVIDESGPSCHLEETFVATSATSFRMMNKSAKGCQMDLNRQADGRMSFVFSSEECAAENCGAGLSFIDESSKTLIESVKFE